MTILKEMDAYERNKLADALKEAWFKKGDYVIREGDQGEIFYLIMSGKAIATKVLKPGMPAEQVASYKEGDYFGERAILKSEARAASIIAESELQVILLERKAFRRLLGPVEQIMHRNIESYKKYS